MPLDPPTSVSQESVPWYAAFFDQQFPGRGAGKAYTIYANSAIANDPSVSPYEVARAFTTNIAFKGLGEAIKEATQGIAQGTAKVPAALPGSIPSIPGTSGGDDWAHLTTRLAEFGIGASLVLIGISAFIARSKAGQTTEKIVIGRATGGRASTGSGNGGGNGGGNGNGGGGSGGAP